MRNLLTALLLVTAFLSGCLTQELWTSEKSSETYRERLSSVLISNDGKTLVIVGKDYHYIFDAPPTIVHALSSSYQKFVTAALERFQVDASQRITGHYTLYLSHDAPEAAKTSAMNAGFHQDTRGQVRADGILTGTRYSAGNVKVESNARALNREYLVDIAVPRRSELDVPAKLLLTPVAVLGDGVLAIAGAYGLGTLVALSIAVLPMAAAAEIICGNDSKMPKCSNSR